MPPAYVDGYAVGATVSIGVVLTQDTTLDMPELLAQADQALYYAKERGRNRVEVATFDHMHKRKDAASPRLRRAPRARPSLVLLRTVACWSPGPCR